MLTAIRLWHSQLCPLIDPVLSPSKLHALEMGRWHLRTLMKMAHHAYEAETFCSFQVCFPVVQVTCCICSLVFLLLVPPAVPTQGVDFY